VACSSEAGGENGLGLLQPTERKDDAVAAVAAFKKNLRDSDSPLMLLLLAGKPHISELD
jgi:hypothetical protein